MEADVVQEEVEAPFNRWCACGHTAPETFRREGPESPATPTRFFLVTSKDIKGIYCEPCLMIANYVAKLKKQGKV
jgi:hypothetical protein